MQEGNTIHLLHSIITSIEGMYLDSKGKRPYKEIIDNVERILIEDILAKTEGNQLKASKILGINRNTLRYKIKRLRITLK